jgi:dTDP-4-dehydrorhamnose reductase
MRILVFGETGQLARELARVPGDDELILIGRERADFTDPQSCAILVAEIAPDAVINAVAYTAVDRAEDEEPLATTINATTPGAIATACAEAGIPLVHVSTDYVFDGAGSAPWRPEDATGPLGAYGRSKLAGEEAVRAADGPHAILRTSWVVSAHGANFVKTMLRLGATRDSLTVVADQIGGPTPAADLAAACLCVARGLADGAASGTWHFSGAPDVSWADFAREIFAQAGLDCAVIDIPGSDYPTPAARPGNSRLECSALETVFAVNRPDWRVGLRAILKELEAAS